MSNNLDMTFVYAVALIGAVLILGGGFLLVQDWPSNATNPGPLGLIVTGFALQWWVYLRAVRIPRLQRRSK